MDIVSYVIPDMRSTKLMKESNRLFNDVSEPLQSAAILCVASGDAGGTALICQHLSLPIAVISPGSQNFLLL